MGCCPWARLHSGWWRTVLTLVSQRELFPVKRQVRLHRRQNAASPSPQRSCKNSDTDIRSLEQPVLSFGQKTPQSPSLVLYKHNLGSSTQRVPYHHSIIMAAEEGGSGGPVLALFRWFICLSLPFPHLSPQGRAATGLSPFYMLPRLILPRILSGSLLDYPCFPERI